ncbi:MAG: S53 family peptidase [Terracidiphilus sp.]|jgi:subtilase family serine protease
MKRLTLILSTAASACALSISALALAQSHVPALVRPHVYTPQSSLPQPANSQGQAMARTHLRLLVPSATQMHFGAAAMQPKELPPFPGYLFETPASLGCVYELVEGPLKGCNPNVTTANPTGGSNAIALVDAFDDPTASSDLATFSAQFGLPAAKLTVVFADGTRPGLDPSGGFEIEEALDTEWAHAMAPEAEIFLVEAKNNSLVNLFNAVTVASNLVAAAGGGEVSMSFGGGEFVGENTFDTTFTTSGVVYFASAGDSPGVEYPSASPNVVSAGGTSISRDLNTGNFILESTWQDSGGGVSQVEPRPAFQNSVKGIVGSGRGTPDLSFDSNPTSGVWVFDSNPVAGTGWFVVGGTSVAAPSLAGIVNAAHSFRSSSMAENQKLYTDWDRGIRNIFYGNCGINVSDFAGFGYNLCAGLGTVKGLDGK